MGQLPQCPLTLVCPECQGLLSESSDSRLACVRCDRTWVCQEGVPHFIDSDIYWGEPGITREILQAVVRGMGASSWHELLGKHAVAEVRSTYKFLADLDRARWHRLATVPADGVVLDLGAGMGTNTHALAQCYRHVVAVEQVRERVEFMQGRFKEAHIHNVSVIRSDIDHLPFPPASFDLIALNGVLEWLPFSRPEMNPREAQIYYLKLVKNLLKPGGVIYVGIENRYYYANFLGNKDPHVGVPWVTVLPRWLAHLYSWMRTRVVYRPYLYSTKGYQRLLSAAGYRQVQMYSALPSYNDPVYLTEMSSHSREFADKIWVSQRAVSCWIKEVLIKADLLKHMGYAYAIFARKDELAASRQWVGGVHLGDGKHDATVVVP